MGRRNDDHPAGDDGTAPHDRTEGWPTGLYLAYLTLRNATDREAVVTTFGGSTRHVGDYLAEVALDRLDPETREFLLETSVLERMCGALCDATTARAGSAERLVDLEHANLFLIPLDDRREWYRYHHLFADLLRDELGRRAPDQAAELHHRAFEWLRDAGRTGDAIRHALAAGQVDAASRLLAEAHGLSDSSVAGYASATLGAVRARLEDLGEAHRLGRQGLERMRTGTDTLLLVQVLLASVPVCRALGSADDARASLDEATRLIGRCADPGILRARYDQVVQSAVASGTGVGNGELTARELDVLHLLGTRLSQRDIGRELFVSYNTVHTHLRSIYRKLGVSSRPITRTG